MAFKINDRVRYTGRATFRQIGDDSAIRKKRGSEGTVIYGPVTMPMPYRKVTCYTIRFDDGDEWMVREGDLAEI